LFVPVLPCPYESAGAQALSRCSPARALRPAPRRDLLNDMAGPAVLCTGDLEQSNILRCQRRFLVAIDPSHCIGDPAYWATRGRQAGRLEDDCQALARHLSLDPHRVWRWTSVLALTQEHAAD
jgi:streptomycin 6-kinase